jgi:hypothetical protein
MDTMEQLELQLAEQEPQPGHASLDAVVAARAAGTFLNHVLNNSLQSVMYRAELLCEHEDPQVAEAGRWLAQCVRAMADNVRRVGSIRHFATVAYPGAELMLDPACLDGGETWSS